MTILLSQNQPPSPPPQETHKDNQHNNDKRPRRIYNSLSIRETRRSRLGPCRAVKGRNLGTSRISTSVIRSGSFWVMASLGIHSSPRALTMGIASRSRGLIRIRYFGNWGSEFSENGEVLVGERTVFSGFFVHPCLNFCYWIWVFFFYLNFLFLFLMDWILI